ncbi:GNAT family N-acetyltransferase [Cohnella terricola]|uniref:GNAT family N-acetyltransferase n=1 Tax=Cohnella terricola TaxID=1289167 RepID=UPI0016493BD3|nr:GNAT family N-acetyltransferase [Cohnella terricola]
MQIRQAEKADYDALREIYFQSRNRHFKWLAPSSIAPEDFDKDTEDEFILIAADGERVLGFSSVWVPTHFIHHLFVHPDFAGQGVGTALLEACCERFVSPRPTLKCVAANTSALNFYQSRGWTILEQGTSEDGPYYLMEYTA